jgi:outer membrane immunogenic protein
MQGYSRIASVTCSIAFGVCALAGVASAADLPLRNSAPIAPVVVAPPIFTWTGLYAGVNLGYDFASGKKADPFFGSGGYGEADRQGFKEKGYSFSEKSKGGVMGGAQVGYNYQLGQVVLGVEADVQMLTLSREATVTQKDLGYNGTLKQTLSGLGTVRGRIGSAFSCSALRVMGSLSRASAPQIRATPAALTSKRRNAPPISAVSSSAAVSNTP